MASIKEKGLKSARYQILGVCIIPRLIVIFLLICLSATPVTL